jgi:hypothetical protein
VSASDLLEHALALGQDPNVLLVLVPYCPGVPGSDPSFAHLLIHKLLPTDPRMIEQPNACRRSLGCSLMKRPLSILSEIGVP